MDLSTTELRNRFPPCGARGLIFLQKNQRTSTAQKTRAPAKRRSLFVGRGGGNGAKECPCFPLPPPSGGGRGWGLVVCDHSCYRNDTFPLSAASGHFPPFGGTARSWRPPFMGEAPAKRVKGEGPPPQSLRDSSSPRWRPFHPLPREGVGGGRFTKK